MIVAIVVDVALVVPLSGVIDGVVQMVTMTKGGTIRNHVISLWG